MACRHGTHPIEKRTNPPKFFLLQGLNDRAIMKSGKYDLTFAYNVHFFSHTRMVVSEVAAIIYETRMLILVLQVSY